MSTFIQTVIADAKAAEQSISNFFASAFGQELTEIGATAAGGVSALAIIEKLNPADKQGTSNDIYAVASAAETALTGTTAPTLAQVQAIFADFKSNDTTSQYASLATEFATEFTTFAQKYAGANWVKLASAYIYGWQVVAEMLGGSAAASATVAAA